MSAAVDHFVSRLEAAGCRPQRCSDGWRARCPAHEDSSPSLSVAAGDDGRVLLCCHAKCPHDAIARALGIDTKELFDDAPAGPKTPTATKPKQAKSHSTWQAALPRSLGKPSATWPYHNEHGKLVGVVARWNRPGGKKEIRPASLIGGQWQAKAMPTPRPLFRLPELIAAGDDATVIVVEGEKACDAVRALGLVCTTSAGGSGAASQTEWSPLAGRRVVIFPDHDAPGEEYVREVSSLAYAAGAASVLIMQLADHWPECPAGGDVADWLASRGDAAEPAIIRAEIARWIEAAEPVQPDGSETEPGGDDAPIVWQPFPADDALPEPLRSFVREGAESLGCDESMVGLPLLSMVAGAIGTARTLRVKPQWKVPAVLWTAIVSESGSGKSPAFRLATGFTEAEQSAALARHAAEMDAYETALADYELAKKKSRGRDRPDKPKKPIATRFVTSDATVEAIVAILQGNPRGVTVAVDELAGWFTSHDAYRASGKGGLDRPKWLSMYDAGPVTVDRRGSGTTHVPAAAASICGGVQPSILRGIVTPEAVTSGLVGRFVFAMPPRRPMAWSDAAVSPETWGETRELFEVLLSACRIDPEAPACRELPMTREAAADFRSFAEAVYARLPNVSGAAAAMLSKLPSLAARFALVHYVVRQAGRETRLPDTVDATSVRAGIAMATWADHEQRRIYSLLLPDGGTEKATDDANRLAQWLAERGGVATGRDLARGPRWMRDGRREAAESRLISEGRAVREPVNTGGRPTVALRLLAPDGGTYGTKTGAL